MTTRWISLGLLIFAIGLILFGILETIHDARGETGSPEVCMDAETREKARTLMLAGTEEAFKEHTRHMFEIWMKDQSDQPRRAITGMRQGIVAYVNTRKAAMRFNPPLCKE